MEVVDLCGAARSRGRDRATWKVEMEMENRGREAGKQGCRELQHCAKGRKMLDGDG